MGIFRGTGGTGDSTTDTTVTTVTQKAAEAASSATSAANSATSAANSASSASTSETNAATSETNAANSASNASTSETNAATYASQSFSYRNDAANSAYNASVYKNETQTLKTQTESLKDTTILAATAASGHADDAETAYADTLAIFGDAQDVQDAVDSASASATTATTKAAEAASSATDASNYSSSAGTSATQAASSASQAATSAASANSYATDAQTAQTAAETAQAAAEAAEANINGLYLGSLADDPTLDGNGVAVTTGDLYFNTTEQEVRVYTDGDEWIAVIEAGGDATFNSLTSNNDVVVKGNLEVQGTTITVDSATAQTIDLGDNDKIRLGDSDDFQIYHDGTDSYIANTTGTLKLSGNTDVTGNITVSGTVDGRDIAADGTTLDAVASTYVDVSGDTLTGDLAFGDNVKAKFGDSDDLQIYHDGTHSWVNDAGTGDLILRGNNVRLMSAALEYYLYAAADGAVSLYHNNSAKLATTSSGVDITGTVVADKFEATSTSFLESTNLQLSAGFPRLILLENDTTNLNSRISHQNGSLRIETLNDAGTTGTKRLDINHSTGDISFYDDSGTSQDFYWDASTSRLGLGTTSPSVDLEVNGTAQATNVIATANSQATNFQASASIKIEANNPQFHIVESDGPADENINMRVTGGNFQIRKANDALNTYTTRLQIDGGTGDLVIFADDGTSQDFYWDASTSRLGLGTTGPNTTLHLYNTGGTELRIESSANSDTGLRFQGDRSWLIQNDGNASLGGADYLHIYDSTAGASRLAIDTSGNVGIGTTSPGNYDAQAKNLVISTSGNTGLTVSSGTSSNGNIFFADGTTGSEPYRGYIQYQHTNNFLRFGTAGSEAARIDSSGNFLVGTTDNSPENNSSGTSADDGIALMNAGYISACNYGAASLFLNRTSTDGEIAQFRKDGSTVGSIGVDNSDNIFLSGNSSHSGLMAATDAILPYANGSLSSATEDFGSASYRWRNLYLSGGVYLGGTDPENLLDDYEEGTFIPTFGGSTTNPSGITYDSQSGEYTKIGEIVHARIRLGTDGITSVGSGVLKVRGLPFAVKNDTGLGMGVPIAYNWGTSLNNFIILLDSTGGTAFSLYNNSGYAQTSYLGTGTNANRLWVSFTYATSA